jgi:hypothetical protein
MTAMGDLMEQYQPILDQIRLFVEQQVDPAYLTHTGATLAVVLSLGVGLSVLGAKLARFSLTCGFVIAGGLAGIYFSRLTDVMPAPCVLGGAALLGTIGYLSFRLWVGILAAVVVGAFVLGGFGYQRVSPHLSQFDPESVWSASEGTGEFSIPLTPDEQQAYRDRTPGQRLESFWTYVNEQDASLTRHGKAIGMAAVLAGMLIGLTAARFTLIVASSLVGTVLVVAGLGGVATSYAPSWYQAGFDNPGVLGAAMGAFLVASLIVQTLLTRNAPAAGQEPAGDKS